MRTTSPIAAAAALLLAALLAGCSTIAQTPDEGPDAEGAVAPEVEATEESPDDLEDGGFGADDESAEDDAADDSAASGEIAATVTVDGREFTIELSTCMIYEHDVMLSGVATETGGDAVGYLDGDATASGEGISAEFRIDIGATGPFDSMDEFISIGNTAGSEYDMTEDDGDFVITASAWDDQGTDLGVGTIEFRCF